MLTFFSEFYNNNNIYVSYVEQNGEKFCKLSFNNHETLKKFVEQMGLPALVKTFYHKLAYYPRFDPRLASHEKSKYLLYPVSYDNN